MNFETIKMEIASNPQYVSIVRLTTSGIANKVGFCLDDIEDMKVAVSEACTNAIKHSSDNKFSVEYTIFEDGLTIKIVDSGKGYDVDAVDKPNLKEPKESGLGLFIIQSLMDELEIKSNINYGTVIKSNVTEGEGLVFVTALSLCCILACVSREFVIFI